MPETNLDLSIVIVAWRTPDDIDQCLESLFSGGMDGLKAEVILVDNASGDGTPDRVRAQYPAVRVLENTVNVGFAGANNQGIAVAYGRCVLLLNPDTLVPPRTLARCIAFLDAQDDRTAAMTCRVESPDGSLQWTCARRLITPWSECCRALLLDRVFKRSDLFNPEPMLGWDRSDTRNVECLLGAFMLIRHSALDVIGGLDDGFFLMYEDTDWCKRAADAGMKLVFWPDTRIVHTGGQSWKQDPIRTFAASHASVMRYFNKHHPRSVPVVRLISQIGMELKIALLHLNLLRRPGDAYSIEHLEMARAARLALREKRPARTTGSGRYPETGRGGTDAPAAVSE